jgi:hypothetical protein
MTDVQELQAVKLSFEVVFVVCFVLETASLHRGGLRVFVGDVILAELVNFVMLKRQFVVPGFAQAVDERDVSFDCEAVLLLEVGTKMEKLVAVTIVLGDLAVVVAEKI